MKNIQRGTLSCLLETANSLVTACRARCGGFRVGALNIVAVAVEFE